MIIAETAENYLEMIYMLHRECGRVRAVDVAARLGVSRPTVSVMMKQLRENGYAALGEDGAIVLTERGARIARSVFERHNVIASLLQMAGVCEKTALADACKIEHDLSRESFECLKAYYKQKRQDADCE